MLHPSESWDPLQIFNAKGNHFILIIEVDPRSSLGWLPVLEQTYLFRLFKKFFLHDFFNINNPRADKT